MRVRVNYHSAAYESREEIYENVDSWEVDEFKNLHLYAQGEQQSGFATFTLPIATYQGGIWNKVENLSYVDGNCKHCGKIAEADGDHTCSCPLSDEDCTDHG